MIFQNLFETPVEEWPDGAMRSVVERQKETMSPQLYEMLTDDEAPFMSGYILKRIEYTNPTDEEPDIKPNVIIELTWPTARSVKTLT